ncbi:MAG: alanine racemase [Candidatus Baltobacteraceae bacterium]
MIAHIEVDCGAIRRNVARLSALVAPARLVPVIKANAYGHGLAAVGQALAGDIGLLAVYRVEEAATLRAAGVATPILILGPIPARDLPLAHECDAAIALWDRGAYAADAARVARARGRPFAIHAKVDTGVTRLGLDAPLAAAAIANFLDEPALALLGTFTHLAAAEELESAYTLEQLTRFESALAPLDERLRARGVVRHAAASAAAMLYPQSRLDLVRAGIAIYGIWPSPQTRAALAEPLELEPALTWRSELVFVRDVAAGTPVGYGCTYRTPRAARIGVLPIGYAEGVSRALSNRGTVLVRGTRAPIVGRVCMNVTMIDVSEVPGAAPGDPVTLLGRDGDERIDAEDWGQWAHTIGYEIVARLPSEIPRTFVDANADLRMRRPP